MPKKNIIACEIFRLELEAVTADTDVGLELVEIALHRTPQKMPERLNALIKKAECGNAEEIIMGYGLCSNGVAGVSSKRNLCIARCHDCLGLLLGSTKRHLSILAEWPRAFYMFAGMVEAAFDPLTILEKEHIPRLGEKKAWRGMELAFKEYTHFAYIESKAGQDPKYKQRFWENCRAFKKEPLEFDGDLEYITRLVHGPRTPEDFIMLTAGESLKSEDFHSRQASEESGCIAAEFTRKYQVKES